MNKNEKRKIIRHKSIYRRKWKALDELQFQWIMFMVKKEGILKCKDVRPNVKILLLKHGKNVEQIGHATWEIF